MTARFLTREALGGGQVPSAPAPSPLPIPSAPIPANYDVVLFGDSRTEDGIGSVVDQSAAGYQPFTQNIGVAGWIGPLTDHRLRVGRYANFGISLSKTSHGAALPRQDAYGNVTPGRWDRPASANTYSSNKGTDAVAAHGAGVVVLLMGTNDGSDVPVQTEANLAAIMTAMGSGKVIVLVNELPRGVDYAGVVVNAATNAAERYTLSRELLKYDFASGDAKARANVVVVNGYDLFLDPASGTSFHPRRGVYRDGLHFTPYGARLLTQAIVDRLAAVWTGWPTLPGQVTLPTANGLSALAAAAPFVNSNPVLTPGNAGAVSGSWGGAPLPAGVPEGWTLAMVQNGAGVTCIATKGEETDPDGYPVWKLAFSGTIPANASCTVRATQVLSGSALAAAVSAGLVSAGDRLRATAGVRVEAGSVLLSGVEIGAVAQDATASRSQSSRSNAGTVGTGVSGNQGQALNAYLDACQSGGWIRLSSELIDMQDANLVAAGTNIQSLSAVQARVQILFRNNDTAAREIAATVRLSRAGVWRAAG